MMLLVVRRNKELKWSNNKISTGRYSFGLKEGRKESYGTWGRQQRIMYVDDGKFESKTNESI